MFCCPTFPKKKISPSVRRLINMLLLWWPNQTFENKALFFENRSHNITREKNQYWQNLAQRKLTEKKKHHAIKIVFVKENHTKKENQFWVSAEKKSIFLTQIRIFWENVILLAGGECHCGEKLWFYNVSKRHCIMRSQVMRFIDHKIARDEKGFYKTGKTSSEWDYGGRF